MARVTWVKNHPLRNITTVQTFSRRPPAAPAPSEDREEAPENNPRQGDTSVEPEAK